MTDKTPHPFDFVDLATHIPEAIIDSRYYGTNNFVGREIAGYDAPNLLMTQKAADALKSVQDNLSLNGLRLFIFDAYRPQCAVDDFLAWSKDPTDQKMKETFYPNIDKATLFDAGFLVEQSTHSRGSTVDLTLANAAGEPLSMGTIFDFFGEAAHAQYQGITPIEAKNRITLAEAMIKAGFLPYLPEWWHFTLKDEPYPNRYFNETIQEMLGKVL